MMPLTVPVHMTAESLAQHVAGLKRRRECIEALCSALDEYLAFDVERQLVLSEMIMRQMEEQKANAGEVHARRREMMAEALVSAQANRAQVVEQLAAAERMEKEVPAAQGEYFRVMLRPELESRLKSLDGEIERLQAELDGKPPE